jgi:hypothetical protein
MGGNYDASMAAYSYNRSIPGFSAAAVASGVPPLPIYQGWNQDAMPLPPYTAPSNHSQYSGYGGAAQTNAQYYQPVGQQNYHQNTASAKSFEQADLSIEEMMALATWILHIVLCILELRITALNLATKVCSAIYLLLSLFY